MRFGVRGTVDPIKERETIMACRYSVTKSFSNEGVFNLTRENAKRRVDVLDDVTHASDG
jgi:hypothetical protein